MRVISLEGVRGVGHDHGGAVFPRIYPGGNPSFQGTPASKSVGFFNDLFFFGGYNPGNSFD